MSPASPSAAVPAPLLRGTLCNTPTRLLKKGGWANARVSVVTLDGTQWVVKDFQEKIWLVRQTLGRFLIRREWRTLLRLQGVPGIPARPFRLDEFGLGYLFEEGVTLAEAMSRKEALGAEFFMALEEMADRIHRRGYVHLDLRNGKNVLVAVNRAPRLIDFQAGLWIHHLPDWGRTIFTDIDRSGIYKWWNRFLPGGLDAGRRKVLEKINRRRRRFWPFNRSWSKPRKPDAVPMEGPPA